MGVIWIIIDELCGHKNLEKFIKMVVGKSG
jgi:hypothetical protein